ncbi:arsenate reductase family protein [Myroides sp. TSA_177.3]|uniref:arsenate reductase family protein n=1 Tax=Myroides sp. TSA_177.3 TaxID=3415650 RepID=UPI0040466D65
MRKIYYLSSCDTCKRILGQMPNLETFELQDIKKEPVTAAQLQALYAVVGSYEKLFNKRAQLYKARGLKDQNLQEEDYKNLILEQYTFLNRPVIVIDEAVFVGNSKKVVEEAIAKATK